jgi:hypothetical protein
MIEGKRMAAVIASSRENFGNDLAAAPGVGKGGCE